MERVDLGEEELKPVKPVTPPGDIAQLLLTNIEALDKIPTASLQEIDATTTVLLDELEKHTRPTTLGYVGVDDPVAGLSAMVIVNNRELRSIIKGATLGVAEERARIEKSYEVVPKDIVALLGKKYRNATERKILIDYFSVGTENERVARLESTLALHRITLRPKIKKELTGLALNRTQYCRGKKHWIENKK